MPQFVSSTRGAEPARHGARRAARHAARHAARRALVLLGGAALMLASTFVRAPQLAAQQAPATQQPPATQVQPPRAITTDPPRDSAHPARMEVLHIPTGSVKVNGVAYLASGAGAHPTFLLLHGWPGNEKNLDLAQAVRRAGWNAITFNYRGSWGSPGRFSFAQNLEDAAAVLAFLRDTANAKALGVDTTRIVIAGHSMGGWVTVLTAARDHRLAGAILISAADMGRYGSLPHERAVRAAMENSETLAATPEQMADELEAHGAEWRFARAYSGLAETPLLVITSDDGLAPVNDSLVAAVRARGNQCVATVHLPTDHSYSDQRIALESAVLRWLDALGNSPPGVTTP
ncbi:MAG TPA: alpha/beta fold hydrolase [Gemmatimonadaceae bacterium]|nr:alpha/beta fold hydrolase [Gemmatimonadaceae bacterium]